MHEDSNRLELVLCVLRGEVSAHLILADLLEEKGDSANASFARSDRKNLRKRLDLTIGLMPAASILWLSCDLMSMVVQRAHLMADEDADEFLLPLSTLGSWGKEMVLSHAETPNDDEIHRMEQTRELVVAIARRYPISGDYYTRRQNQIVSGAVLSIDRVAQAAIKTRIDGRERELASNTSVGAKGKESASHARKVAAFSRYLPNRLAWESELKRQIAHTATLIEQMF